MCSKVLQRRELTRGDRFPHSDDCCVEFEDVVFFLTKRPHALQRFILICGVRTVLCVLSWPQWLICLEWSQLSDILCVYLTMADLKALQLENKARKETQHLAEREWKLQCEKEDRQAQKDLRAGQGLKAQLKREGRI